MPDAASVTLAWLRSLDTMATALAARRRVRCGDAGSSALASCGSCRKSTRYPAGNRSRGAWMRSIWPCPQVATDAKTFEVYHLLVQDNISSTGHAPSRDQTVRRGPARCRKCALGWRACANCSHKFLAGQTRAKTSQAKRCLRSSHCGAFQQPRSEPESSCVQ